MAYTSVHVIIETIAASPIRANAALIATIIAKTRDLAAYMERYQGPDDIPYSVMLDGMLLDIQVEDGRAVFIWRCPQAAAQLYGMLEAAWRDACDVNEGFNRDWPVRHRLADGREMRCD